MFKFILGVIIIIIALVSLVGCVSNTAVLGECKSYEITSGINSLYISINAADFTIEHSDKFFVESNLKNLTVTQEDGVLKIVEKTRNSVRYNGAILKLYIPEDLVFEDVVITTGAGRLTADYLSANTMKLKSGAGKSEFGKLDVNSNIKIKGGAGQISILDGTLNNLSLDLGVGELDMTAELLGKSNLKFGVGASDLTLIGSQDDYSFDIQHGIGEITIDNNNASAFVSSTNGQNLVKIKGGIGATNITFQK